MFRYLIRADEYRARAAEAALASAATPLAQVREKHDLAGSPRRPARGARRRRSRRRRNRRGRGRAVRPRLDQDCPRSSLLASTPPFSTFTPRNRMVPPE